MKKLNRTIEKTTVPNLRLVTSVNSKFLYSLCAALFLLTCSLSTKAQNGTGTSDLATLPYTLGFGTGQSRSFSSSQCTSCYPLTNNHGDPYHSGKDKWIRVDVGSNGYLSILGGTADFDSVFSLYDLSGNLIAYDDDGTGSGDNIGHNALQPWISYQYVTAGTYYLIIDGTDKYIGGASTWTSASGSVNVYFRLD
jgi:hypothetical protein